MQVEFFHDVVCSFCFPMSYRMRKISDKYPKLEITHPQTEQAVLEDLQRVQDYGIQGAPAIVVNQKYLISGAQPQEVIEKTIEKIAEEGFQLQGLETMGATGEACNMVDGKWVCD